MSLPSTGDADTFNPAVPATSQKGDLLGVLMSHFRRPWGLNRVNAMMGWHGCRPDVWIKIAETGFASLAREDSGYFGHGVYATLNASYACLYATGDVSQQGRVKGRMGSDGVEEWCIVLGCIGVGMCYPVTRDTDYRTNGRTCDLEGKGIGGGYDSHVAGIGVHARFQATDDPTTADAYEVVLKAENQMLPLGVVWFRRK